VLKDKRPETKIMVCEPDNSQILASSYVQKRNPDGSAAESHPDFRPHVVQGWTPDFIPKLAQDVMDAGWIDELLPINGANAMRLSQELARQEGIFVGPSAGATIEGALRIAEKAEPGTVILAMAPDTGERYLTTPLFEDIQADMNEEEMKLSRSTPSCRFDGAAAPSPAPAAAAEPVALDPKAKAFVEEQVSRTPIAFFALEWCEFCWSVRKMLKALDIEYASVDLDSVDYQKDGWGGKIRAVLKERLGTPTIPQIFVGGEWIGGATEFMDAYNEGRLQKLFDKAGISYNAGAVTEDAYNFLPKWLQKR
jgi:cysteine synthase A